MSPKHDRASQLGPRLRAHREKLGYSGREVARRAGVNSGYLSQLERGSVRHPAPTILDRLADAYELPYLTVLEWAGYTDPTLLDVTLSTNQLAALSAIGDPTDEELRALRGVMAAIRAKGQATFGGADPPRDRQWPKTTYETKTYELAAFRAPLRSARTVTGVAADAIASIAAQLRAEADARDRMRCPTAELLRAARLSRRDELQLEDDELAALRSTFGPAADRSYWTLLGVMDFRSREVWIRSELPSNLERLVLAHEIGHGVLRAHAKVYADDMTTLTPSAVELFEGEANRFALELILPRSIVLDAVDGQVSPASVASAAREFDVPAWLLVTRLCELVPSPLGMLLLTNPGCSQIETCISPALRRQLATHGLSEQHRDVERAMREIATEASNSCRFDIATAVSSILVPGLTLVGTRVPALPDDYCSLDTILISLRDDRLST
jgi:transcriptional regulator with XRE-family HTH domain